MTDNFQITIQSMLTGTDKWNLVAAFLRLRRKVFIERMNWQLHHAEMMEFEQYDRMDTVYILAHSGDHVLGGARLLRTDRASGSGKVRYSYMIRDAYLGLLDALPRELCDDAPPCSEDVWELTRLISDGSPGVGEHILESANHFLSHQGASSCLFLGPPAFMRMARSMGFAPQALGKIQGNRDGRFLAFDCLVQN